MQKRTLYFTNPGYLSQKNRQLVIQNTDKEVVHQVPIEDIGFLVLEHQHLHLSMPLVQALMEYNVAVICCNSRHMPQSMLLNFEGHHQLTEVCRQQAAASEALKNNLWKQTVVAKIGNQARSLEKAGGQAATLWALTKEVRTGDTSNREGMAARYYWKRLFGKEFSRHREGPWPNALLNYGYAILRAATARALTGSGLLPAFGIHHSNRFNAFCLADDIMEPYRPLVDVAVYDLWQKYPDLEEMPKEIKAELLQLLAADVQMQDKTRPLMVALTHTSASLADCFAGKRKKLNYPILLT